MIGIMDWGIGGLSVYTALRQRGNTADVLYFSDSGTTPYGKLSRDALRLRLIHIAQVLAARNVHRVLVACHAASSALHVDSSGAEFIAGVAFTSIIPASRRLVQRSTGHRLGVIGGQRTIASQVYEKALAGLLKTVQFRAAQPLSAFVEAGELHSPAVAAEIRRLLALFTPIDSLLLACTHYPALTPVFAQLAPTLELLDPGMELAATVTESGANTFAFFTTGDRRQSALSARAAFNVEI